MSLESTVSIRCMSVAQRSGMLGRAEGTKGKLELQGAPPCCRAHGLLLKRSLHLVPAESFLRIFANCKQLSLGDTASLVAQYVIYIWMREHNSLQASHAAAWLSIACWPFVRSTAQEHRRFRALHRLQNAKAVLRATATQGLLAVCRADRL